jgi:colicin import membrane protein
MAAAEPPATVPDEVTTAATPEPVTVLSPPAEPETVAPQAMAPEPPPATVVAALPEPPRQPEPMAAAESAGAPATGSHVPDPPVDTAAPVAGIETVPVSSIPAVDDAPIPRPKPQLALADPNSATGKPDDQRPKASPPQRVKAKAKPRRRATLSRRLKRPLPPSTPLESQQNQFPFFDNGVIGDAGGRSSSPADQASAGRPQRAGYAIRPPTGPAR